MNDLKKLIEHELEYYLEWPATDKSIVTTTSAKLFAEHVAKLWAGHIADAGKMVAPAVQGEPVGEVRIEIGDTSLPSFVYGMLYSKAAPNLVPGTKLYAAPQPAEQQPDATQLVEALDDIAKLPIDPCSTANDYRLSGAKAIANAALAPYRKGGEV
ncbi:hypothetical protein [Halopseudomonas bauzanensis]|uniref:hypothetical protein n=1 Tax=Halopseudomonas bauzanensis TaxID=653930 RepID=UPI0025569A71|nr:hypothetical protein [Halopseudomonas bauzanensis]